MASKDTTACPVLESAKEFQIWKFRIVAKLKREKVYDVLHTPRPSSLDTANFTSLSISSTTDSWETRDAKAHGIIIDHISDRLVLATQDETTAANLFNKLVDIHEKHNVGASAFYTFIGMLETRWDGNTSTIQDHIATLAAADAKLTTMKKPIDSEFLAFMLLHSLPDDPVWEMFKTSVLNSLPKDSKITFDDISDRLIFNAMRQQGSESALKAKTTKGKNSAASSSQSQRYCSFHKTTSHDTKDCYTLKKRENREKDKEKGKRKGSESANKSSQDASDSESDSDARADRAQFSATVDSSLMTRVQAYASSSEPRVLDTVIILDSGASTHMTPHREWFLPHTFKKLSPPRMVRFGDSSTIPATGIGNVVLCQIIDGKEVQVEVRNVLFIPAFTITLLSVRRFNKAGFYSIFKGENCTVKNLSTKRKILEGRVQKDLYQLACKPVTNWEGDEENAQAAEQLSAHASVDINVLHNRMGHIATDQLKEMVRRGNLLGITHTTGTPKFCEPCALGKMKKLPFKHKGQRATRPLQVIHSDVGGPVTPTDRYGNRYWISFIDDSQRFPWIYFMDKKSKALGIFKQWKKDVEALFNETVGEIHLSPNFVQFLQTDGGGEYNSAEFEKELRESGIVHHTTAADTPEQDGLAERMNQTIVNLATTMLIDSGLDKSFWSDAMSTAAFMKARTPSAECESASPYKGLFKREVDASWFRPFGSRGYALIPKDKRSGKFSPKGRKCILLGYTSGKKAYRLLDVQTKAIFHSRHVRFDEAQAGESNTVDLRDGKEKLAVPGQWEESSLGENFMHPLSKWKKDATSITPRVSGSTRTKPETSGSTEDSSDDESDNERVRNVHHGPVEDTQNAEPPPAPPSTPPRTQARPLTPPKAPTKRTRTRKVYIPDPTSLGASRPRRETKRLPTRYENFEPSDTSTSTNPAPNNNAPTPETEPTAQDHPSAEGQAEEPTRHVDDSPDDVDDIYFAGISSVGPEFLTALSAESSTTTPATTAEAFGGPDALSWQAALTEEMQSLADNDVYEIVPIPDGVKPITSRIVMRTKLDSRGDVERHKIRIVARGFTQKEGVDYKEVFAPVANLESIRIIIALAAKYNLELDQMDVSTAYLNGELVEELYMLPPKEVAIPEGHCWRLKRSLYGLKQAGRTWNHTLDKKLREMKFTRLNAETCLYVYRGDNGEVCFLVVYVDDFILAATSRKFMDLVKAKLSGAFKMKDLGPASYILGIQVIRDRENRTISLSQSQYAKSVVKRCGMSGSKPTWTPMAPGLHLTADDPTPGADNNVVFEMEINGAIVSYASVVGSLGYAVTGTRPDLAYVVSVLGRFLARPKLHHWHAAKRALRYLETTADMVLRFDGRDVGIDMDFKHHNDFTFSGFSDADWSGCPDTSKSTSGFVFVTARGAIGWGSKLQSMVSLSSTESEYIGLCNAGQHLAWLRTFFEDINCKQVNPTDLYCDNQAAIILSKDAQFRARTKHIQRKYHFIRDDIVAKGQAVVRYIPTDDMVADILTKALSHEKHWKFTKAMGLRLDTSGSVKNGA